MRKMTGQMPFACEYVRADFSGGYNRGMEEYFDEIILLVACAAVSLCFADANHVVIGILLSISLGVAEGTSTSGSSTSTAAATRER